VIVHVDKAGGDNQSGRVDRAVSWSVSQVANGGDFRGADTDVGSTAFGSGSINYGAVCDYQIEWFLCADSYEGAEE
jgi:hypothetical protein